MSLVGDLLRDISESAAIDYTYYIEKCRAVDTDLISKLTDYTNNQDSDNDTIVDVEKTIENSDKSDNE